MQLFAYMQALTTCMYLKNCKLCFKIQFCHLTNMHSLARIVYRIIKLAFSPIVMAKCNTLLFSLRKIFSFLRNITFPYAHPLVKS